MAETEPKTQEPEKETPKLEKLVTDTSSDSSKTDDVNTDPSQDQAGDLPSPSAWFNSYFGGEWVTKAKEQTLKTLESVKKDLNEFSDTVNQEATALASAGAKAVKQQAELFQQFVTTPDAPDTPPEQPSPAKTPGVGGSGAESSNGFNFGWMKSMVETVKSLTIEDTASNEADFTEPLRTGVRKTALDQFQLLELQNNETTFLQPPTQFIDLYKDWLIEFKLTEYNGEINILLGNNPKLREIYAKFVPSQVDNHTFWNRYFFKVYVAEMERELRLTKGQLFNELAVDIGAETSSKLKVDKKESEVSPANTENESWSVCSSGAADLLELPDEADEDEKTSDGGPLTPKARELEDSPTDGWEKWEQQGDKEKDEKST